MPFLVRKIIKRNSLIFFSEAEQIENMSADAATTEFRTSSGSLSTWLIPTMDKLDDAVLAIAVTSSKIERMDFIVMDPELIKKHDLYYVQTYAGQKIAVPDLQDTHHDIIGVTLIKLINCAKLYQDIYKMDNDEEKFVFRYNAGEIKELIRKALDTGRIKIDLLSKNIKEEMKLN